MAETSEAGKIQFARRRTGCMTCKKRRVRCDEARPICSKCLAGSRECQYAPVQLPLRDRRKRELGSTSALPGEQDPWVSVPVNEKTMALHAPSVLFRVNRVLAGTSVDPFRTLPARIGLKAQELLHYYFTFDPTNQEAGIEKMKIDGAGLSLQHPIAFQSTLLVAASHYTWSRGSLFPFKEIFFSYILATIQSVNGALLDPDLWKRGDYIRLIVTLAHVECCTGNLAAAETHLIGLASLLNARWLQGTACLDGSDVNGDEELADRCVILFATFIGCIYSRVTLYQKRPAVNELMDDWHERDVNGFPTNLAILRSLPAFFVLPADPSSLQRPVDVSRLLGTIRLMTRESDIICGSGDYTTDEVDEVWRTGTAAYSCIEVIQAHTSSYARGGRSSDGPPPVPSTLSGMLAAKMLYLGTVLGMLDVGWKPLTLLVPHVLRVIVRDLGQSGGSTGGDLWLWKAFMAWIGLSLIPGCFEVETEVFLYKGIRSWSQAAGMKEWEDAKMVLGRVAWPKIVDKDGSFEDLWKHIMAD